MDERFYALLIGMLVSRAMFLFEWWLKKKIYPTSAKEWLKKELKELEPKAKE